MFQQPAILQELCSFLQFFCENKTYEIKKPMPTYAVSLIYCISGMILNTFSARDVLTRSMHNYSIFSALQALQEPTSAGLFIIAMLCAATFTQF